MSVTKTVESGAFIRTTIRHGAKRKIDTKRIRKNDKKVVLGTIGDLELYVYPYDFPDTVFLGAWPISTQITSACVGDLMRLYNEASWFLKGEWQNKAHWRIAPNSRRRDIVRAYNLGLIAQRAKDKARISPNLISNTRREHGDTRT